MVELGTHSPHSDLGQTDSPHVRPVWDKEKSGQRSSISVTHYIGVQRHKVTRVTSRATKLALDHTPEIRVKFAIEKRQPPGWSICWVVTRRYVTYMKRDIQSRRGKEQSLQYFVQGRTPSSQARPCIHYGPVIYTRVHPCVLQKVRERHKSLLQN